MCNKYRRKHDGTVSTHQHVSGILGVSNFIKNRPGSVFYKQLRTRCRHQVSSGEGRETNFRNLLYDNKGIQT